MKKRANRKRCKKCLKYKFKKSFMKTIEARTIRKLLFLSKNEATDFLTGIPPLKKTDKLLHPSENLNDTCINRGVSLNECHLPEAYMNSAFLLLTMIELTNTNSIRDGLIFPALFSFRHFLELSMKDSLNRFEHDGLDELVIQREHSLCKLWNKLSLYIEEGEDKDIIQNLLFEINRIDPNGELFRYPYEIGIGGMKKQNSLPSGIYEVKKLKTTMLKIYRFLSGINYIAYNSSFNVLRNG